MAHLCILHSNYPPMKTAFTLLFSLALVAASHAQTTNVTFAVDMTGAANFRPGMDTLRVAGNFQRPNEWTPRARANDNILTDPDGNGVYSVTYKVAPGSYQYKYVINIWADVGFNEDGGTSPFIGGRSCLNTDGNRALTVTAAAMTTPIYLYNTCTTSAKVISGVKDFAQLEGVELSPNPVVDQASLTLPAGGTYQIRVMGSDGRILSDVQGYQGSVYSLQRDNLASGLYLVEVLEASRGERAVLRFTIQ